MKIAHLVGGSLEGGAARGAYWLHRGLRSIGVGSVLLTDSRVRVADDFVRYLAFGVAGRLRSIARTAVELAAVRAYRPWKQPLFSPGLVGYRFDAHPDVRSADVVHLHWVNAGFVNVARLGRVDKPVVWTLRDMWPITGGCHYAAGCDRFTGGCGRCPELGSSRLHDLSWWGAKRKAANYPRGTVFVAISSWLADEARRSAITGGRAITTIGNNVDCDEFRPIDRVNALAATRVDPGAKKIVLVGAQNLDEAHKGFDAFLAALDHLDRNAYTIAVFGRAGGRDVRARGFDVRELGYLRDSARLREAYSAADVFVAPSRLEAFGKTIAEAMACRCPVVCFDATGPRDIVDHRINGYRATPFDPRDLAEGIRWVTGDLKRRDALGIAAREKIVREFDSTVVARAYERLYRSLLRAR